MFARDRNLHPSEVRTAAGAEGIVNHFVPRAPLTIRGVEVVRGSSHGV
jgi:hypothetical protein